MEGVHKEKKLCVLSGKTCGGGPQREETMCSLGKDLWRGFTKRRNYVFSRERLVEGVHKAKKLCVLSGKTSGGGPRSEETMCSLGD